MSDDFRQRVIVERARLAIVDPIGELDARTPLAQETAFAILATIARDVPQPPTGGRPFDARAGLADALDLPTDRRFGVIRCPAHEDRKPSLSWRIADGGRLLLNCFAGCTFHEIRAAVES